MTTLVINTPDASRNNFKAAQVTLNHYGFELSRYHATNTDGGMCIVAHVRHCSGEDHAAANQALAVMPEGTTLYVLH
ncbi:MULTISPECIES: hypothetical protein [unclassified Caballeronia]|uniref:hypothetical protein n=1 Tax=unclassified Caballeronia TaxID=2646786 RepID=UPI001F279385|nr:MULTISPECIES: hypothetical protein [unclassified Caballeronia]MCE4541383.1 hypothetical protein [Caballeronia sp. PC1]MCE4569573.1 hypothetical protein [Caballeronia sp. CLC5]